MAENPQRRAADRVPPDVLLAINEGDADNRHFLRNEFTLALSRVSLEIHEVGKKVETGNLAQVTENARMQATLEEVRRGLAGVRLDVDSLQVDVGDLKAKSYAIEEVAKFKRWFVGFALGIPAAILAATVFLAQHVH